MKDKSEPRLTIRHLTVGQLHTNCYLLINPEVQEAIIIDPGDDADYIMRILHDEVVEPTHIIATHGHFDHILGVNELKLAYDIPFLVHKEDEFLVKRLRTTAQHFLPGFDPGPPPLVDNYLDPSRSLEVLGLTLKLLHTPGHTPGSVGLHLERENLCFVGDVIFEGGGVGRTDYKYASPLKLQDSIDQLLTLPPETRLFPGHGGFTSVKAEKPYHQ